MTKQEAFNLSMEIIEHSPHVQMVMGNIGWIRRGWVLSCTRKDEHGYGPALIVRSHAEWEQYLRVVHVLAADCPINEIERKRGEK